MTMDFQAFLDTAKEVSFSKFHALELARGGCIEECWWHIPPVCFYIFGGDCWIAKFADNSYYTILEKDEIFSNSLEVVARKVWEWDKEEQGL